MENTNKPRGNRPSYEHFKDNESNDKPTKDNQWKQAFKGAKRTRTKRLVLSYVKADESFETVRDAIVEYAKERGVTIGNITLLKYWEGFNPTYTLRLLVSNQCLKIILDDDTFWPPNVNCREWVPQEVF